MNHPTTPPTKKLNTHLAAIEKSTNPCGLVDLKKLPSLFEDSSCELWCFKDNNENYFIKLEKETDPSTSTPFWLMMQSLFDVSLSQALSNSLAISQQLIHQDTLQVPEVIQSITIANRQGTLLSEVVGEAFNACCLNKVNIELFAAYLSALHRQCFTNFGSLHKVQVLNSISATKDQVISAQAVNNWQKKLRLFFMSNADFNLSSLQIDQINALTVSRFVPVMMDLRWDQFAMQKGLLSGVFDLDAYVTAPIELDFVILEYLLNKSQLDDFVTAYQTHTQLSIPKITHVRQVYRHLFFIINALGETDYKKWMAHPCYFS